MYKNEFHTERLRFMTSGEAKRGPLRPAVLNTV
jgi:hypothetical protein